MKCILKKTACIFLLAFSLAQVTAQTNGGKRVALVIGAQNYTGLPPLRNSLNDAKAMTAALKGKGFQVESLYDPKTKREIKDAINRYFILLRDEVGAVGVIFYAGHGMQYEGDNYIIPTTATLQNPGDLDDYCVKMNTVMAVLKSSGKSLNILLLDACRSLPSFTRDTEAGLTRMDAPQGAIIVFATQPGKVASDGTGVNGLFTSKLLKVLNEPNLNINDVFKRVKQEVYAESKESQLPSVEDNSIGGDFYFTPVNTTAPKTTSTQPTSQSIAVTNKSENSGFDYGYGTADAPVVTVGTQTWLGKNLNADHFANGEIIPEAKTDEEWKIADEQHQPAWCYYNNDPANGPTYGKLYNRYAIHDPRGLAPKDWHIPSDSEWRILIDNWGGETIAGTKMKSTSMWYNNGNGDNSSSFAGLPGGYLFGRSGYMGILGYWWSSSEDTSDPSPRYWSLHWYDGKVSEGSHVMSCGFSVRCIRGATATTTSTQPVSQSNAATTKPEDKGFDYGYGTADAPVVTIGTQTWLGKNLNVDHFANGEIIPGAKTDEEWKRAGEQHQPAWCYYKNDPANGRTYGRLYNWYAVHDPRGLAPKGWHVPSDNEWTVLIDYLGGQNYAGKKMKSTSTWESFNGANGNGDNSSGITGLPSGYRHIGGMYASIGEYAFWWSSSESITGYAWGCHLFNSLGSAERHYQAIGIGFPVRCVRN